MRIKAMFALSVAFATCALLSPGSANARSTANNPSVDPSVPSSVAKREAARMVPAQAILENQIDARKMQPGQQFRATLRSTVQLKNGLELPRDTVLVGKVATDRMQDGGTSTLALRFTKAELKGGKVVPIQADIMGVAPPSYVYASYEATAFTAPVPWDGKVHCTSTSPMPCLESNFMAASTAALRDRLFRQRRTI